MKVLRVTVVTLAALVLGAHFLRSGALVATGACLLLPALLFVRSAWAGWALRAGLLLGTLEWVRTALRLADLRRASGQPFGRMLLILGVVAGVTALAALLARPRRRVTEAAA